MTKHTPTQRPALRALDASPIPANRPAHAVTVARHLTAGLLGAAFTLGGLLAAPTAHAQPALPGGVQHSIPQRVGDGDDVLEHSVALDKARVVTNTVVTMSVKGLAPGTRVRFRFVTATTGAPTAPIGPVYTVSANTDGVAKVTARWPVISRATRIYVVEALVNNQPKYRGWLDCRAGVCFPTTSPLHP